MRTLHLFAGAGGGLLADLILGHTPVAAVEWDGYACQVLRERAEEGWFPGLRVHEGDIRLFDPSEYAGRVDCIHAGFPCQDISHAGKQAGVGEDTRSGLYREVLRIADALGHPDLFLENVSAILSNGLGTVLGDLAARGYDCRWTCIRAADVGAPHLRDRWWCLADAGIGRCRQPDGGQVEQSGRAETIGASDICHAHADSESTLAVDAQASGLRGDVADAERDTRHPCGTGDARESAGRRHTGRGAECADDVADADPLGPYGAGSLCAGRAESTHCGADDSDTLGDPAQGLEPGGTDAQEWQGPDIRPARPARPLRDGDGWWITEPDLGRVAHGVAARVDRLKALGNGQVPLQAALAWKILTEAQA